MRPRLPSLHGPRVHELLRASLLALCGAVSLGTGASSDELLWLVPLAGLGLLAAQPVRGRTTAALTVALEGIAAGAAIGATGSGDSRFLPYLIAPAFSGGLRAGVLGGILPVGGASLAVLGSSLSTNGDATDPLSADLAQWVVLAGVVAVVAAWVRTVVLEADGPDVRIAQAEAFRLLTELRTVARKLPGTLDPATSAEAMLERARAVCRYDEGAVLVSAGGNRLSLLARHGQGRASWDLALGEESVLRDVWTTQRARVVGQRLPRLDEPPRSGTSLVVPVLSGAGTFGLLLLESGVAQAFGAAQREAVQEAVEGLSLQLQTGLAFDEVRELATNEERRRLAREIHDGIAQELASLGYALDGLAADAGDSPELLPQLDAVRDEVRRLVTELRMSLFDLRVEVDPDEGLGAAIGRHVRTVGTASGMTVHLSLNEAPVRLGAETEAELLRIVQEAVTNARKHAQATNLWVSCTVDPPHAAITVEDDGLGVRGNPRSDSHGLAIMRERAARIRAELAVETREPRGTRVRVTLGRVRT